MQATLGTSLRGMLSGRGRTGAPTDALPRNLPNVPAGCSQDEFVHLYEPWLAIAAGIDATPNDETRVQRESREASDALAALFGESPLNSAVGGWIALQQTAARVHGNRSAAKDVERFRAGWESFRLEAERRGWNFEDLVRSQRQTDASL